MDLRLLIGLLTLLPALSHAATTIKVCDDIAGWPPYTYENPANKTEAPPENTKVIGAATEIVSEVLKRAGYKTDFTLLPWEKCLNEVAYGQKYTLLMNASYSDERAQNYLLSKPYYTLHSALLYLTSKFPEKPQITTISDMHKYKYCGLQGYNYTMYDLPYSKLDDSAKDEKQRFNKLRAGECDFILADLEITRVFAALGEIDLSGTDSIPIPEARPKDFYMLISKTNKNGPALQKSINDGLDAIKADGTYDQIMLKYGVE